MRSSISVQSCASVPPAPEFTVADRVALVVLAGEQRAQLEPVELAPRARRRPASISGSTESSPSSRPSSCERLEVGEPLARARRRARRRRCSRASSVVTARARGRGRPRGRARPTSASSSASRAARVVDPQVARARRRRAGAARRGRRRSRASRRRERTPAASATVAELVLLAAPAVAGLVAARRLLDPHRLAVAASVGRRRGSAAVAERSASSLGAAARSRRRRGARPSPAPGPRRALYCTLRGAARLAPRRRPARCDHVADEVVLDAAPSSPRTCRSPRAATRRAGPLAHRAEVDALAQVVHLVEVLAPVLVDHREHHAPLDLAERLGADRLLLRLVARRARRRRRSSRELVDVHARRRAARA